MTESGSAGASGRSFLGAALDCREYKYRGIACN
jgi:hypothetical protein